MYEIGDVVLSGTKIGIVDSEYPDNVNALWCDGTRGVVPAGSVLFIKYTGVLETFIGGILNAKG